MRKIRLIKIGVGAAFLLSALIVGIFYPTIAICLYALALLAAGADVFIGAGRNLFSLQLFDESFLMSVASLGAFVIGEYPEAVAVMLLYQIGEAFQSYAVGKSRRSIRALMNIRPDTANLQENGEIKTVSCEEVHIGDMILIRPGERVPLDACIVEGQSTLDTSALTGESLPCEAAPGSEILSGSINLTGAITCRVTKEFEESTASKILELVENASGKKSKSENFITSFARWYTPAVVILALLIAVIPPLVLKDALFTDWLYRALTFLVISCPCALVISVPMSFFAALGAASKQGILIKGSNYLEALSKAHTFVFDKTGTLTKGVFSVCDVTSETMSREDLLSLAAHAECYSRHPIAVSIRNAASEPVDPSLVTSVSELSGFGVVATVNEREVTVGNAKLLRSANIDFDETDAPETCVYIAVDGKYAGCIKVSDEIKEGTKEAVSALKSSGKTQLIMLTGDKRKIADSVSASLGLDGAQAELLPGDKVQAVEELFETVPTGKKLVYVGDGINDAPVLARADVGIAMGSLGSDAAIEAADIVIMTDDLTKIPKAMTLSVKTLRIVKQNIVFSLGVKALVLLLGAIGFASMWAAVFADVGVAVLAILNAMRLLKTE